MYLQPYKHRYVYMYICTKFRDPNLLCGSRFELKLSEHQASKAVPATLAKT